MMISILRLKLILQGKFKVWMTDVKMCCLLKDVTLSIRLAFLENITPTLQVSTSRSAVNQCFMNAAVTMGP